MEGQLSANGLKASQDARPSTTSYPGMDRAPRGIILALFARAPARHVKIFVVEREIDVADQRRHRAETLQQRWQQFLVGGLGRDDGGLLDLESAVLAPPGPDRAFEISGIDDDDDEAIFL